jgi:hypothetical protein
MLLKAKEQPLSDIGKNSFVSAARSLNTLVPEELRFAFPALTNWTTIFNSDHQPTQ